MTTASGQDWEVSKPKSLHVSFVPHGDVELFFFIISFYIYANMISRSLTNGLPYVKLHIWLNPKDLGWLSVSDFLRDD